VAKTITFLLALAGCCATPAACAEPALSPERSRELTRFVRQECGFCHGLKLTGGLGSPLTAAALRDRPAVTLMAVIRYGIPGTAMPGWAPYLSERDMQWIVEQLLQGFPDERR
jgi:cytochrome c55X